MHPSQPDYDAAQRVRNKERGLTQVRLWVPRRFRQQIVDFAARLRSLDSEGGRDDGRSGR